MSRLFIGALAAGFLIIPSTLRAADDDPKAILEKAIKAHGGEEFLAKHLAGQSKNKGKITIAGVGEVEFTQDTAYMLPDKFKESIELTVAGQKINVVTLMNGDKISIESNGTEVPVSDQIKSAILEARHMIKVSRVVLVLKEKGFELNGAGEIKVNDQPAVGVRVSTKGQKDINLYFDKKTGLLAKIEHRPVDPNTGNEVTEERIIVAYQKNEAGIPLPKKVTIKRDGSDYMVADVLEVKLLEKLNDSEFAK